MQGPFHSTYALLELGTNPPYYATTMFKTAATKIAHNSTLPALGGNQDLRPLQDLIAAEKTVLISYAHLNNGILVIIVFADYRNSVLIIQRLQRHYGHGV